MTTKRSNYLNYQKVKPKKTVAISYTAKTGVKINRTVAKDKV